jgi:hypothetical protein
MPSRLDRYRAIARESGARTNEELDAEISRLTPLRDSQIARLLPNKGDKEKLAKLMEIVLDATEENEKIASLRDNIEELGSVAIRILGAVL